MAQTNKLYQAVATQMMLFMRFVENKYRTWLLKMIYSL